MELRTRRAVVWGVVLAVVLAGLTTVAFFFDAPTRQWILAEQQVVIEETGKKWHRSEEGRFWSAVSKYGDWPQLMLGGGVLLAAAIWRRRQDWTKVIIAAMLASTLAGILANASRLTTGRVRPRDEVKHGAGFHGPWHNGRLTIGDPGFNSFPSGHTATAIGFAAPFLLAKPLLGIPVMVIALAIGWSRMQLGAHHLSDVVLSTGLGLLVGWFVLALVRQRGEEIWQRCRAAILDRWRANKTETPSVH
jgi:membrane-associated phospholipid phosphatase